MLNLRSYLKGKKEYSWKGNANVEKFVGSWLYSVNMFWNEPAVISQRICLTVIVFILTATRSLTDLRLINNRFFLFIDCHELIYFFSINNI